MVCGNHLNHPLLSWSESRHSKRKLIQVGQASRMHSQRKSTQTKSGNSHVHLRFRTVTLWIQMEIHLPSQSWSLLELAQISADYKARIHCIAQCCGAHYNITLNYTGLAMQVKAYPKHNNRCLNYIWEEHAITWLAYDVNRFWRDWLHRLPIKDWGVLSSRWVG